MNFPGCGRSKNYYCPCMSSKHNYILFSIPLNALLISMVWYVPKRRFENEISSFLRVSLSVYLFFLALMSIILGRLAFEDLIFSHQHPLYHLTKGNQFIRFDLNFYLFFSHTIHPYVSFLFLHFSKSPNISSPLDLVLLHFPSKMNRPHMDIN